MASKRVDPGAIVAAVFGTSVFSVFITLFTNPSWGTFGLTMLVYPFVAFGVAFVLRTLAEGVEAVFGLQDQPMTGDWSDSDKSLYVGSMWPIASIAIPFFLVAIVIGGIYRGLMWIEKD